MKYLLALLLLVGSAAFAQVQPYPPSGSGTITPGNAGIAVYPSTGSLLQSLSGASNTCLLGQGTNVLPLFTTCPGSLTVQTGGTNNTSQTNLNFVAGAGVAITNPSAGNVNISASYTLRTVSTTSDTILSTDCANGVQYTSSSAVAVTLPQATGSFTTCNFDVIVSGSGTVTVTPTTSTITNGSSLTGATLALAGRTYANVTAASGNYVAAGTALGIGGTLTIASGTAALGTGAIGSGACATAVTVSATGVATTDTINAGFNGDPTAVTGYVPSSTGMLAIVSYPTSNNVNFKVCNNTGSSITPGAITLNWHVLR